MTTRVIALTVVLDEPKREDDVQELISAIRLMRGVSDVQIFEQTSESHIAYIRAQMEIRQRLWKALNDEKTP